MSAQPKKSLRRMLPRWRVSSSIGNWQELGTLKSTPAILRDDGFHAFEVEQAFSNNPSVGVAADLLAASSMAGDSKNLNRAITFLLDNEALAPKGLITLAKSFLPKNRGEEILPVLPNDVSNAWCNPYVRDLRQRVRLHSDNPLAWSDLARHYASIGDRNKADRCMRVALKLAPNHRWILRTAARFFVHSGDPIAAHTLLAKHPLTSRDPWLLAAEIATAQVAHRSPRFLRQAGNHIKSENPARPNLSELATALAMVELENGGARRARRLVDMALINPTENTLAQVTWARQHTNLNDSNKLSALASENEQAFEARFGILESAGNILLARTEGMRWAADEPFATRPLERLVFLEAMLDNYSGVSDLANKICRIEPRVDTTLNINEVFSLLSSGSLNLADHRSKLGMIRAQLSEQSEATDEYHALANLALWHYRYGDAEEGRVIYERVMQKVIKNGSKESVALAATFAAREAILAKQNVASSLLTRAHELAESSRSEVTKFYLRKLDAIIKEPERATELLAPSSAQRFVMG